MPRDAMARGPDYSNSQPTLARNKASRLSGVRPNAPPSMTCAPLENSVFRLIPAYCSVLLPSSVRPLLLSPIFLSRRRPASAVSEASSVLIGAGQDPEIRPQRTLYNRCHNDDYVILYLLRQELPQTKRPKPELEVFNLGECWRT